jgi:hypothetical protein
MGQTSRKAYMPPRSVPSSVRQHIIGQKGKQAAERISVTAAL